MKNLEIALHIGKTPTQILHEILKFLQVSISAVLKKARYENVSLYLKHIIYYSFWQLELRERSFRIIRNFSLDDSY